MKKTTLAQMFLLGAFVACFGTQLCFGTVAFATPTNTPISTDSATIGNATTASTPSQDSSSNPADTTPIIVEAAILGDFDYGSTGISYFQNIRIYLVANNLDDDHFLSPEGLHWSDKTEVELIKGRILGSFNLKNFSAVKPGVSAQSFRMEPGDTGRITYVGKTKSGVELDLIWEVVASDKDEWRANSGFTKTPTQGLAFVGAQAFEKESSNSICVLYDTASNLALHYRIVKHATTQEMPVVVSFISTDIDSAQGVETDLANIVELIPKESGLAKKDNIIYDTTSGAKNLNGAQDLPRAGYLGASFTSNFTYVFYSPAPARVNNSYYYSRAVRYDIFGSSLQAKLLPKIQSHITINYISTKGKTLKPTERWQGFTDESYNFKALIIDKYQLVDIKKDETDPNHPSISFIYAPLHKLTFSFVDEEGNSVSDDVTYDILDEKEVTYTPPAIRGLIRPDSFKATITQDTTHSFVYKERPRTWPDNSGSGTEPEDDPEPSGLSVDATTPAPKSPAGASTPNVKKKAPAKPKKTKGRKPQNLAPKKSAPALRKPAPQTPSTKPIEPRDPFLVNTGMSKEDKKQFLEYIAEVTRQAKKKYGNDQEKINHTIANAIAYPAYKDNFSQNAVNDFGGEPNVKTYKKTEELLLNLHGEDVYMADLPHIATTLASMHKSSPFKEFLKFVMGSPTPVGMSVSMSARDNFFQLNSMAGDKLTHIDEKDRLANIDSFIFQYHPTYKNMRLDEAILKYYHQENLPLERDRLYKQALESQKRPGQTQDQAENNLQAAMLTIGAPIIILAAFVKKKIGEIVDGAKKFFEGFQKPKAQATSSSTHPATGRITLNLSWSNNPLDILGVGILNPIGRAIGTAINTAGKVVLDYVVKPIANITVVPLVKHVVAPVFNNVVKPAAKAIGKAVAKVAVPVLKAVAKPVVAVAKAVVDAGKYVYKTFIKPKGKNGRIRPNRKKTAGKSKKKKTNWSWKDWSHKRSKNFCRQSRKTFCQTYLQTCCKACS